LREHRQFLLREFFYILRLRIFPSFFLFVSVSLILPFLFFFAGLFIFIFSYIFIVFSQSYK